VTPARGRILTLLALCVWLSAICLLWLRTGQIPAASSADDIWWNESAFWLWSEGTLARRMHPDTIGSDVSDFQNPLLSLVQFVSFSVFGLTQFAAGFSVSLFASASVLVLCAILLDNGLGIARSLLLSLLLFANVLALEPGLAVRPEILYGFLLLLVAVLPALYRRNGRRDRTAKAAALGALGSLASLAYYPAGPAALLLSLTGLAAVQDTRRLSKAVPDLVAFSVAFALPWAAFLLWKHADLHLFLPQILENAAQKTGSGVYFNYRVAALALVSAGIVAVFRRSGLHRILPFVGCILLAASMPLADFQIEYPVWLLFVAGSFVLPQTASRLARVYVAVPVGLAGLGVLAILAFRGAAETRDYATYQAALSEALAGAGRPGDGFVVIDNPPHLALRSVYGGIALLHAPSGGGASFANSPVALSDPATRIEAVIVRDRATLDRLAETYPAVRTYLSGDCAYGWIGAGSPYRSLVAICEQG
jgi:hypothetical protein